MIVIPSRGRARFAAFASRGGPLALVAAGLAPRFGPRALRVAALCTAIGLSACENAPTRGERHWRNCICTYVSDFDDQSAAPIDVCTDDKHADDVAAICIRNDGVGVPTGCHCDPRPIAICTNADRCRAATDAAAR